MKEKIHTQYILSEGIPAEGYSSKGGRIHFWKLTTYENANNQSLRFSWIKRLSFSQLCEKRLTKWWHPIKRCENMVWKNSTQCTIVFGIRQYLCFVTLECFVFLLVFAHLYILDHLDIQAQMVIIRIENKHLIVAWKHVYTVRIL